MGLALFEWINYAFKWSLYFILYTLFFLMPKPFPIIFIFRHLESVGLACIAEMSSLNLRASLWIYDIPDI